jgi:O-antigen ligase
MTPRYTQLVGILLFLGFFLPGMPLDGTIPAASQAGNVAPRDISPSQPDVIFWGLFYLAAAALCLRRAHQLTQIAVDHWTLFFLVLWLGLSSLWAADTKHALMIWVQLVGSLAFAATVAIFLYRDTYGVLRIIAIALAFSMGLNVLMVFAVPSLAVTETGRWAGVTGNPNYLGSLAGVAALTAIVTLLGSRGLLRKSLFGLASCLSIYVIIQSDSMTSLVALLTALSWYWFSAVKKFMGGGLFAEILFVAVILALSTLVFVQLSPHSALDFMGRDPGLTGRTGLWEAGSELVMAKPFAGYGLGSDTLSLGVLHRATNFHNGFLELTIQGGLIGMAWLVLWFAKAFRELMIGSGRKQDARAAVGAILVFSLIHNLAESSFAMARSPVWLALLVSVMVAFRSRQLRGTRPTVSESGPRPL